MNIINLADTQRKISLSKKKIKSLIEKIMDFIGIQDKTIGFLLVDDKEIKKLNKIYRKKDAATDVLAFSMQEGKFGGINPEILGDVVISVETAQRCAEERSLPLIKELSLYLIHGVLHLRGYRDDDKNKRRMKAKEKEIFEKLWKEEN